MAPVYRITTALLLFFPASFISGAQIARVMYDREITFSGYEWQIKSSISRTGPGPNFFSQSEQNVTVDQEGRLHLRITREDGRWLCAEVVSRNNFGYGRYEFILGTNPATLNENIVLGLFTWNPALRPHHNEIDIEFSSWGGSQHENGQYVIHTCTDKVEKKKFTMPSRPRYTTHVIIWKPGRLVFESYRGRRTWSWRKIASWTITGSQVPVPVAEQLRMNLWLTGVSPGSENLPGETVIRIDSVSYEKSDIE